MSDNFLRTFFAVAASCSCPPTTAVADGQGVSSRSHVGHAPHDIFPSARVCASRTAQHARRNNAICLIAGPLGLLRGEGPGSLKFETSLNDQTSNDAHTRSRHLGMGRAGYGRCELPRARSFRKRSVRSQMT